MAAVTAAAAPSQDRAKRIRRRKPPTFRTVLLCAAAYLVALIFVLPYLEMIVTALRPQAELRDRDYLPHHITFSNFTNIWSTGLGTNLAVSLEISIGATVLVLLVAIPAAYYTSRRKFRGRGVFLLLVLVTQMFQPTSLIVGIYQEFTNTVHLSSTFALILVNAGFNLAFAIWILNAYFGAIPKELEEAAMVDGTSRIGAMFRVIIPLALPGIVTALIFTFIAAWNEFITALTLTNTDSSEPLTVKMNTFIGQYSTDWQHLFAGSVIATIPVIILFAFIEGKVVSGLTAGSVK
ncbi:carbohydrate ABC transporter permease [Actinospica sp.]|jgi:multiple sugar transport system permease protein|uniref:carbohydrate ABC transporter permease n=1 Tax=Actinospica sp. TaxID=1872142 RepID=UPI002CDCEDD8|nr:carbohydrate ABC transporter permease [Actinospica sp.]HWG23091.1 carbohydrate ABC transporter permease [Actinospica sp.]